jgi:hypothetical protein
MFEVLNSYLFQHKSISIPGLGTIFLERSPAQTDLGNQNILPPSYFFRFDKYFDAPDKDFFSFLAAEKNIPDYEAIKWYNEFSYNLRNKIRLDDSVSWDDVGVLKKDNTGNIVFETVAVMQLSLEPVRANTISRKDLKHLLTGEKETSDNELTEPEQEEEKAAKKETWWIYALAIAVIASGILIYHFSINKWHFSTIGNQQKLEQIK